MFPGSYCPNCYHFLKFRYNTPLFGWFFFKMII
ncbi:prepilin peptidase [Yersinia sp. LJYL362]